MVKMHATGTKKYGTIIAIRMIAPRMDENVPMNIRRESPCPTE